MKKYFLPIMLVSLSFDFAALNAKEKRTDGPPGSEWADFGSFEGDLSIAGHFGALLSTRSRDSSSFVLGIDADYRPYDLFGFRGTILQGFNSPKSTVFSMTPLAHTQISNFHPYVLAGPGIAILNDDGTRAKFLVSFGVGGDVVLTKHFGIGMEWLYHAIVGAADANSLDARISYKF